MKLTLFVLTQSLIVLCTIILVRPSPADQFTNDLQCEEDKRKGGEEVAFEFFEEMKIHFVWIPEGKTTLGSPKNEKARQLDEPEHDFATTGYWLAKYECTQKEWHEVMETNPSYFCDAGEGRNIVKRKDTSRFPVEQITWNDCQEFLKKINERGEFKKAFGKKGKFVLPHEDQWEYAARGGKGNTTPFYWGTSLNGTEANCGGVKPYGIEDKGEYLSRTATVGSYSKIAPHPWGLADITGNIWEWCDNWYDRKQNAKVLRGGSWYDACEKCRTATRTFSPPGDFLIGNGFGFRLFVELEK